MKATKSHPLFTPIILHLESQAEVDAIHAILNHTTILRATELPPDSFEVLAGHTTKDTARLHQNINEAFKTP